MAWTNYHSHSHYCDGKMAPEAHIQAAIDRGFVAWGCSSHAPVDFEAFWAMKRETLPAYCQEINHLKEKYAGQLQIYLGLEVDFIPGRVGPRDTLFSELDYTVGSVHFVDGFENGTDWCIDGTREEYVNGMKQLWDGNARHAVERYYALTRQMLEDSCPDILGHMDKIKMHNHNEEFFSEKDAWYRKAVIQTLEVVKAVGIPVEVNTRGMYKKRITDPYPSPWVLEELHKMGIPVMINSDSHHPREIDFAFSEMAELLLSIGFKSVRVLWNEEWQDMGLGKDGVVVG